MKENNFKDKEKRLMEFIGEKKEKSKTTIDERNKVLDKTRQIMETRKGYLTKDEEEILTDIAGVLYAAYKKYIEINEKQGEREDEEYEL